MTRGGDFWSRRRAAVAQQEAQEAAQQAEDAEAQARTELEAKSDAEILDELDLPDPDTLEPGQDVQQFMAHAVPERIRNRALRQLWKLNPVLANVDGLVEYGEDFTDAATVIENLQTTYQVGKGMLAHLEALAEEKEAEETAETGEEDTDTSGGANADTAAGDAAGDRDPEAESDGPSDGPVVAEVATALPDFQDAPEDALDDATETEIATLVVSAPRRMRFAFET